MRVFSCIVVAACSCGMVPMVAGAPARFWISTSRDDPGIPHSPTINAAVGRPIPLYIWAQPATNSPGDFRKLEHFSLDVVTLEEPLVPEPEPFIDFVDGTFKVENPTISGQQRFQHTTDSFRDAAHGGPLTSDRAPAAIMDENQHQPDALRGLQGVSPFATPSVVGIGNMNDPSREGNAWLVAEFSIQALQPSGTNDLYLQIGWAGMRHENDGTGNPILSTQVMFGADNAQVYTAGPGLGHRQKTFENDTFDIRINAVEFKPGDYNSNGSVGEEDYSAWRSSFGSPATPGAGADGNRDEIVNAADYVFWRKLLHTGGGDAAMSAESNQAIQHTIVPEPAMGAMAAVYLISMFAGGRRRDRQFLA